MENISDIIVVYYFFDIFNVTKYIANFQILRQFFFNYNFSMATCLAFLFRLVGARIAMVNVIIRWKPSPERALYKRRGVPPPEIFGL